MRTKVFHLKRRPISAGVIQQTVKALQNGGVIVVPTDTVYGLAASAFHPDAIKRIYRLKGRSYKKRLPFLVADFGQARALVEPISQNLKRLLDRYWPGPLTVVFKCSALGRWVTGGKDTIALRIPDHASTRNLLRVFRRPLAATSANPSGKKPAASGTESLRLFRNKVEVLWNAGRCPGGEASTVLDASSYPWTLVREGAVRREELLHCMS